MIEEKELRVLSLLFWQTKMWIDTSVFVPLHIKSDEEIQELGDIVRNLHSMELVDAMEPKDGPYEGMPLPIPNPRACELLEKNPDAHRSALEEWIEMCHAFMASNSPPKPLRKKKFRRVSG